MITLILMSFFMNLFSSARGAQFDSYPANSNTKSITCKKLDYSSYFQADRAKTDLIRNNPDLTHPNFGGKYLLLKTELLMETLWLIADCETGKFFHEKLSSPAIDFKPTSLLVELRDHQTSKYLTWSGDAWDKVESPSESKTSEPKSTEALPQKTVSPKTSFPEAPSTGVSLYSTYFTHYSVPVEQTECKNLDFGSYFKAQEQKANILKLNSDLAHANFAGHFLLLKNELLFETLWLIADCRTGKFFPQFQSGTANFKPDSGFVYLSQSGDFPVLLSWTGAEWITLVNTISKNHEIVKNTLSGADAKKLFSLLPNADHSILIHFKNLICASDCHVEVEGKVHALSGKDQEALLPLLKRWGTFADAAGTRFKIDAGKCSTEKLPPLCEIQNSAF